MPCIAFKDEYGLPVVITFGNDPFRIVVGGKVYGFDLPPYCSLVVVDPLTGDERRTRPPKAFWDALERWERSGKPIGPWRLCIVPEWCPTCGGKGDVRDPDCPFPASSRNRIMVTCTACGGSRLEPVPQMPPAPVTACLRGGKGTP